MTLADALREAQVGPGPPAVGQVVHYSDAGDPLDGEPPEVVCRPALVTSVGTVPANATCASLVYFTQHGTYFHRCVSQGAVGLNSTWHWPC